MNESSNLLSAERQLLIVLPKMVKGPTGDILKEVLTEHLEQTKHRLKRLEHLFKTVGNVSAAGDLC